MLSKKMQHISTFARWDLAFRSVCTSSSLLRSLKIGYGSENCKYVCVFVRFALSLTIQWVEIRLHLRNAQINLAFRSVYTNFVRKIRIITKK